MKQAKSSSALTTLPPEIIYFTTLFLSFHDWLEFKQACKFIARVSAKLYELSFSDMPEKILNRIIVKIIILRSLEKGVKIIPPLQQLFLVLSTPPKIKISLDGKLLDTSKIKFLIHPRIWQQMLGKKVKDQKSKQPCINLRSPCTIL